MMPLEERRRKGNVVTAFASKEKTAGSNSRKKRGAASTKMEERGWRGGAMLSRAKGQGASYGPIAARSLVKERGWREGICFKERVKPDLCRFANTHVFINDHSVFGGELNA